MHTAPTIGEKYLFVDQNKWSIYVFGFLSTAILLFGNSLFVYYNPGFWPYAIFVFVTAFYLSISYIVGFLGKPFDIDFHKRLVARWIDKVDLVSVDVYLPVCGEDLQILYNTWSGVAKLRYAHPHIKVHVLDDGKKDDVRDLAKKFHFNYIRRDGNELKKAGNLRNAFKQTDGEFIVILDADFVPRSDFLIETLPYMFEYSDCGIVQTPQYFTVTDHQTWIGQGASAVQELFYRLMQVNRNTFNGSICVGTCGLYRRSSLEPFGGTAPIEYSEDVHTGFQIISTGGSIKYIPVILSKGICPDELRPFITQQYRWSLGSISLLFSSKFWQQGTTKMQKLCYMNGQFYYVATGLAVIFGPLPAILMLIFVPEKILWFNLLFSVPSLLFSTVFMWWWMKSPMGIYVLRSRCVAYYAHLMALKDYLLNTLEEWKPTNAKMTSRRYDDFKKLFIVFGIAPQFIVLMLVIYRMLDGYNPVNFSLLMCFWVFNMAVHWPVLWSLNEN